MPISVANTMLSTNQRPLFPACRIILPDGCEGRRAAFYLAVEEYVAAHFPEDTYLMTWQLGPTVVMGRHQVAHQEVDLEYCERHHIDVIRRRSGGGAIYADEGNIMVSLITGPGAVEPLFAAYAAAVSTGLRQFGAPTTVSGRNDIVLEGGGKICGNAFYHLPDRNIVHGTMLYDTHPERMEGALHPERCKLQAAGVASVRSRVALLKDYLSFGVAELRESLHRILTDRTLMLTAGDVAEIETLEQAYYDPDFLYGRRSHDDVTLKQRFEGVGTVVVQMALHNGTISDLTLAGDYFETEGNATARFREALVGCPYTDAAISERLDAAHPEAAIRNMTGEHLQSLFGNSVPGTPLRPAATSP